MHAGRVGCRIRSRVGISVIVAFLARDAAGGSAVTALYGHNEGRDQYGVEYITELWGGASGFQVYGGAVTFIDRRYDKHMAGDLEAGLRFGAGGRVAPWCGVAGTFGFSQTRLDQQDYDTEWQAAVMPEAGLNVRFGRRSRLVLLCRYVATTDGPGENFWVGGLGFGWSS